MEQQGEGGLTTILNTDTYEQITDRPMAVNRMNVNVGERPIAGIPYLRNKNMTPMDVNTMLSRDRILSKGRQDTARLGQSLPSLPDRRTAMRNAGVPQIGGRVGQFTGLLAPHSSQIGIGQEGGNIFKKIGKTVKKGAKAVGKAVKKARDTKIISKLADAGAKGALFLGHPEIATALEGVSVGAKSLGFGLSSKTAVDEVMDDTRGVSGMDKQSFVATHPLNFNRATLANL